ncbi:MAG: copper resistance protein B [Kangiellaceae bacterium]|nr:copper resistance protein B [Kangiellaceae bacterium]
MKNILVLALLLMSFNLLAGGKDDPVLASLWVDQFEYSEHDNESIYALEADFWIGKDLDKFWLKTEIEKEGDEFQHAELQALYSKAIAPYWDLQLGVRHDFEQPEERTWAVIGYQGLAPYYFEIDAALFVGDEGRVAARFQAEYEMMLTQKWVLVPEFEANFYAQNDPINHIGSGLSDASLGLRLSYEFVREFAFYIGYERSKTFGRTADYAELDGKSSSEGLWVIGFRGWL